MEIIIQDNGDILIPRGEHGDNMLVRSMLSEICNEEICSSVDNFLSYTDNNTMIFGNETFCG